EQDQVAFGIGRGLLARQAGQGPGQHLRNLSVRAAVQSHWRYCRLAHTVVRMRMPRRTRSVPRMDAATRISPFGLVCLVLVAACLLLAIAAGGYFTSLPNPWRSGGEDDYYGPTGRRVRAPDDESS